MSHDYEQIIFDAGLHKGEHAYRGTARDVYRGGGGPAVLVLSEIPGITPDTVALCKRLIAAGYSVVLPQLVGHPGRDVSVAGALSALSQVCISREFDLLARRKVSPISEWLRSLARAAHAEHGGPGVGVIGMCLTGGFALAMMIEPAVVAPVLSQPSLPLPLTAKSACALGLSDPDLTLIKNRLARENLSVLGLRFTRDPLVPSARFQRLRDELGEHFISVEIDSSFGNPHGFKPWAHSVLTHEFVDEPSHPTRLALDEVLDLFARKLIVRNSSVAE